MRIALISDIHANFVALQTVLTDIERNRVDKIVCLGDVAAGGPQPCETLERVRELGCSIVCGNTDEWFRVPQPYDPNSEIQRRMMVKFEWAKKQLAADEIGFIRTFQARIELALDNGNSLLGFHGSPQSNMEVILATTPDDDLARMLGNHRATVMAGGHTHVQMLRRFRDVTVVNPGSVGLPVQRDAADMAHRPPWSEYAIVNSHGANVSVEFHRVPLDVTAVVNAARASGMPGVNTWVGEWTS